MVSVISDSLHAINEALGYEYFKSTEIVQISDQFVMLSPVVEELIMKPRGVTLENVEKEQVDYERGKQAIKGIFHGIVLRTYEGLSKNIGRCRTTNKRSRDGYTLKDALYKENISDTPFFNPTINAPIIRFNLKPI